MTETVTSPPGRQISDRWLLTGFALLTLPLYVYVLAWGRGTLLVPSSGLNLTFNSMLEHLLMGEFHVDAEIVGREGFVSNGKVYSYFGILPALLRLPLIPFVDLRVTDATPLMCLLAVWTGGIVRAATVLMVARACPTSPLLRLIVALLLASIAVGGAQLPFLTSTLYQEVIDWASLFAAMFVYLAICGIIAGRPFSRSLLVQMGIVAGLALLTRVTIGLGLYTALGLLLAFHSHQTTLANRGNWQGFLKAMTSRDVLIPVSALAIFALLTGVVNMARWGKPWVFMPMPLQIMNEVNPDRIPRLQEFGAFNLVRLPFGIIYYFAPVWTIPANDGRFFLTAALERYFDGWELPPASFFLSDPLLLFLAGIAVVRSRSADLDLGHSLVILLGLAVPPVLMLTAIYAAYRYRVEFYPFMEFGAYLGLFVMCRDLAVLAQVNAGIKIAIICCALVGVAMGPVDFVLYRASPFGPAWKLQENGDFDGGLDAYYRARLQQFFPSVFGISHHP